MDELQQVRLPSKPLPSFGSHYIPMIKCIYREDNWTPFAHCNEPADYTYMGKSYCAPHMEIRSSENNKVREAELQRMDALRAQLQD
jgi:hypothetical protein